MLLNVSKRHLRALIVICIISVLAACAPTSTGGSSTEQPLTIFSADYYIMKQPAESDYTKLQQFMSNDSKAVADGAALVLGYYYLRDNRLAEAKPLLEEHYQSTNIEPWLSKMGALWLMELAIADKRMDDATAQADKFKAIRDEAGAQEALNRYCTIMKISPDPDSVDGAYNCVTKRLGALGLSETSAGFAMEPISGELNLLITGTGNMLEKAGGIYYYMRTHGLKHKIKVSQLYIEGEWDFWLDLDKGILQGKGAKIYFEPDMQSYIDRIPAYIDLTGCHNIVLGVSNRNRPAATDLKQFLESQPEPPRVSIIDINDANVSRQVRYLLSGLVRRPFCSIGIGDEEELDSFTPTVRQYRERPLSQQIYSIMPIDTGAHYVAPFLQYYRNSLVYPVVDLTFTPESIDFVNKYKQYSGKDPILEVFVGYDMMHFININSAENMGSTEPYVSNIKLFHEGEAMREIRLFRVSSQGVVERVAQELDEDKVYRAAPPMGIGAAE